MKQIKLLLSILAIAAIFMATACDEWENPLDEQVQTDDSQTQYSADLVIPDVSLAAAEVTDATLQTDMAFKPDFNRHRNPRANFFLNKILRQLNLTDEQLNSIAVYVQDHKDCVEEVLAALRESERAILQAAREEKQTIRLQLQNGEITQEEAIALIRQLNIETKEALLNNPDRAAAITALEDCRETLYSAIRALLTEEQQALWDEWIERVGNYILREH